MTKIKHKVKTLILLLLFFGYNEIHKEVIYLNIIGRDVKLRREELGKSLRSFAQEVGISPTFLSQIETGIYTPGIDMLQKIYSFFPKNNETPINTTIRNHPELILLIELFITTHLSINYTKAKYIAVIYIVLIQVASLLPLTEPEQDEENDPWKECFGVEKRMRILEKGLRLLNDEIIICHQLDDLDLRNFKIQEEYKDYRDLMSDLIESRKMTISEMAAKTKTTKNFIEQILNGNRNPSIKTKQKLIKSLNLPVETSSTYGISPEYANSNIVKRIIVQTNDLKPKYFADRIIKTSVVFTINNFNREIFSNLRKYPDLYCAELLTKYICQVFRVFKDS